MSPTATRFASTLRYVRALAGAPERLTDGQLLGRFLHDRDEAAFAELLRRHGPLVLGVARRRLADRHAAEDVAQAAFLALARQAARLRGQASVAGWLFTVAFRLARKEQARTARRSGLLPDDSATPAPPGGDPLAAVSGRELVAVIDEELARLPERYRLPLLLCGLDGLARDEAAARLGWSLGSLRGRLERGRELLRQRLEARGLEVPAVLVGMLVAGSAEAVPPGLVEAVTRAALAAPAPATWGALQMVALAVGLLTAVGGAGLALRPGSVPAPPANPVDSPPAVVEAGPRTDRFGDPLPPGAVARLGTVQLRHAQPRGLAFTPHGKLRTLGGDHTVREWNPATGRSVAEHPISDEFNLNNAILSPDGRLVFGRLYPAINTVALWDVDARQFRYRFQAPWTGISTEAFSPDGSLVALASRTGPLSLWDTRTGRARTLGPPRQDADLLAFSPDGRRLAGYSLNAPTRIWDVETGEELAHFPKPDDAWSMAFTPDGRTLVTLGAGRPPMFWDARTGRPAEGIIPPPVTGPQAVTFDPDGKTLVVASQEGVLFWDAAAGREVRRLTGGPAARLTFSADGRTLAASSRGLNHASVRIWDLATGRPAQPEAAEYGHRAEVSALAWTPDGRWLASAGSDGGLWLWDTARRSPVWTAACPSSNVRDRLAFLPDGRFLVGQSDQVLFIDRATGRRLDSLPLSDAGAGAVRLHLMAMHLADDGRTLATLCQILDGRGSFAFQTLDLATGRRTRGQSFGPGGVTAYGRFTADGRKYVCSKLGLQDIIDGQPGMSLHGEDRIEFPFALSPGEGLLAAGVRRLVKRPDGPRVEMDHIGVWETLTGEPVLKLESADCAQALFTADGRRLITAGVDGLRLWDVGTGRELARRPAPSRARGFSGPSFASALAVAPDGRTVATGQIDSTVLLWDLLPDRPVAAARPALTPPEAEALWADLAGADAARAHAAVWRLADDPATALGLLRERLRPAAEIEAARWSKWRSDLDSDRFATRERATAELAELGGLAEPKLRGWLQGQPSEEVRRRVEQLLARLPSASPAPERLRELRAVRALELIGTPAARELLNTLARGAPSAPLTRASAEAVQRLARKTP